MSKNFKEREIKGILPDGTIYLKMGVTRKRYNDQISYEDMDQINQNLINLENINKFYLLTGTSPVLDSEN